MQKTKQKRLQYAKANLNNNWKAVLFTDRAKFAFKYPGARVKQVEWVLEGQVRQAESVNHPQVYNLYVGFSMYGVTLEHQIAGTSGYKTTYKNQMGQTARNITTAEYKDVLKNMFLCTPYCQLVPEYSVTEAWAPGCYNRTMTQPTRLQLSPSRIGITREVHQSISWLIGPPHTHTHSHTQP
jgi:hypothetical protein